MGKQFLSWMAAGLAGIAVAAYQFIQAGGPVTLKAVGGFVLTALIVRAANWVVATFGPKPVA
jgi:hypothetical protein